MNELPKEIISNIISYLTLNEISSFNYINHFIHSIISNDILLWINIFNYIITQLCYDNIDLYSLLIKKSQRMKSNEFVKYIKYLLLGIPLSLPTIIDLKILHSYRGSENIQSVILKGFENQIYLSFVGNLNESFRSIVANDCFPFLPNTGEDIPVSVPFTRVVVRTGDLSPRQTSNNENTINNNDNIKITSNNSITTTSTITTPNTITNNNNNNNNNQHQQINNHFSTILQGNVVFSEIGYFECKIHKEMYLPSYENSSQSYEILASKQSFSIGLACPPFSLKTQFPGFDNFSFGYKSEDGNFYQGGFNGISFGAHPYGAGDTVGCGIIYPSLDKLGKGKIFFTRNGKIQGKLLEVASDNFFAIPWFPVVGIDSYYPISLNFGQNPFEFDLTSYEESLRQVIHKNQPIIDFSTRTLSKRVLKLYQDNITLSPPSIFDRKISSRSSSSPPSLPNLTTTTLSTSTSRLSPPLSSNNTSSSRSPSRSPTTINQGSPTSSLLNNTKSKQTSRFTSTYLLHRSLRIIDARTYKFQRDLLTDSDSENENY